MSKTSKIIAIIVFFVIVIGGGIVWYSTKMSAEQSNESTPEEVVVAPLGEDVTEEKTSEIVIVVPKDYEEYREKITEFTQVGGVNPLSSMKFVEKTLTIPYVDNLMKASAETVANEFVLGGGPEKVEVESLEVINGTAYIMLNIDKDGWAGVSVARAIIHPIVEKTLLRFSEIDQVIFDYPEAGK